MVFPYPHLGPGGEIYLSDCHEQLAERLRVRQVPAEPPDRCSEVGHRLDVDPNDARAFGRKPLSDRAPDPIRRARGEGRSPLK